MHGWLGLGLIPVGLGMVVAAFMKRRSRMSITSPAGQIRPEFAAMGEIMRPVILFIVGIFAVKMALLYFVFGGQRFLTPLDFGGILFVLAAYAVYLVVATSKRPEIVAAEPVASGVQTAA